MKDFKGELNKWRDVPWSWTGRLSVTKDVKIHEFTYRHHSSSNKYQKEILIWQYDSNIYEESQVSGKIELKKK